MSSKMNALPCYPPLYSTVKKTFVCLVLFFIVLSKLAFGQTKTKEWSNPILIQGSDFGNIFQSYYRIDNIYQMLNLTSSDSRKKYGDSIIENYYSKMQFNFNLKLLSYRKLNPNKYMLIYSTKVGATKQLLKMEIIVENDTCRLVLPNSSLKQKYLMLQ